MKLIINADDCGISREVNSKIEDCIRKGQISSTTIMANMPLVNDAKKLFDLYKENISFGIHLNITEGEPLLKSKVLLDCGMILEKDGKEYFNIENKNCNKRFSQIIEDAIFCELSAQIETIHSLDIQYSHIDSHHHIHTRPYMINILPRLQKKFGFTKIRRMRNYMPISTGRFARNMWWYITRAQSMSLKTTDWFTGYCEFIELARNGFIKDNATIELMVHPGGKNTQQEAQLMEKINPVKDFRAEIINYNQL